MKNKIFLRELHRAEWENIVIDLISRGWSKGEAQHEADDRICDRYDIGSEDDVPEN